MTQQFQFRVYISKENISSISKKEPHTMFITALFTKAKYGSAYVSHQWKDG
jgi:hypothetical protein